jgi:hypothetical protein
MQKIYEVDPLISPKPQRSMKIISFVEDKEVRITSARILIISLRFMPPQWTGSSKSSQITSYA